MELADFNIRVNAVSPGVVNTPVFHPVFGGKEEAEKALEGFNAFHPIGRIGAVEDISNTIDIILKSSQPVIIAGGGIKNTKAHQDVINFAKMMNIPISIIDHLI